jgi:hypothetical protein
MPEGSSFVLALPNVALFLPEKDDGIHQQHSPKQREQEAGIT